MTKKPKQSKYPKPPAWFQSLMEKGIYDTAEHLNEAGWAEQVRARLSYLLPEKMSGDDDRTDEDKIAGYSRYKEVRLIQQQGIVEMLKTDSSDRRPTYKGLTELRLNNHYLDELKEYAGDSNDTFRTNLNRQDINNDADNKSILDEIDCENFSSARKKAIRVTTTDLRSKVTDYGYLSDALNFDNEIRCLSVDLILPNSILIEQFELFLNYKKNELKGVIEKSVDLMDIKKKAWVNNAVLPFLDLEFWSMENNIDLTSVYYAKYIFKQDVIKDGSNVSRTVKKSAGDFLSLDNYYLLKKIK